MTSKSLPSNHGTTNAPSTSTSLPHISSTTTTPSSSSSSAQPSKLAKNKRLPATMITSSGTVQPSKKKRSGAGGKKGGMSDKKHREAVERAVERGNRLEEKVKGREERKAKRQRAKKAWE